MIMTMMPLHTTIVLTLLLSSLSLSGCSALPELRYRDLLLHNQHDVADAAAAHDVEERYVTQRLDHFDATNEATFAQRYFVSYRYQQKQSSGPVLHFLCVGGEGPGLDKSVLVDSVHCTGDMLELADRLSRQYNIRLYALEHRYYGKSYPTFNDGSSPLETANLKFLSSQQALEDLSHFVHEMNQQTDSTSDTWVTFGGSYPGMMALYARYKYPHLIHAAVSSSAPINAKADFPEYKARQGWDLLYAKVGGSMECHRIVKTGHEQAVALLQQTTTNGPEKLATMFQVCDPSTTLHEKRNQELLLGDGLIDIPAQSNDPSCTAEETCNIDGLCKVLIQEFEKSSQQDDPTENAELHVLAKVSRKQRRVAPNDNVTSPCVTVDFDAVLEEVASTKVDDFGWRSWLYQTCSEFGFYQTCGDDCPFASQFHRIDMDLEICEKAFNITNVFENVHATRDRYGGLNIVDTDATNILSVNGNVDPWSRLALGKSNEVKYRLPIKEVDGASHHFWTHPARDTDTPEIVQAREYIYSVLMDWLGVEAKEALSHQTASNHLRTAVSRRQ
jgi:hypothetical protein